MSGSDILTFDRVGYGYPNSMRPALSDVTLSVKAGEFLLLVGRSGCGKSTLLRSASGLVPHFYGGTFTGRVVVGGLDTRSSGPAEISRVAGSVFQDPESQVSMRSAWAELALPLENAGMNAATVARSVEEAALALGIADLLDRPVAELSGGELQRTAVASALVTRPKVLLMDEPTSQLDAVVGDELIWQLRRLNEEWGTTVVLAEHRVERCLKAADRVVAMVDGRIACDLEPSEFARWSLDSLPEVAPPAARMFRSAGIDMFPVGVKEARVSLAGLGVEFAERPEERGRHRPNGSRRRGRMAIDAKRLSVTVDDSSDGRREVIHSIDLKVKPGERVALLGHNGAGKSTLLAALAGLGDSDNGGTASGKVALVLQNPGDYFLRERIEQELPQQYADAALEELGLSALRGANPRDLSGGERSRLALGIVLAGRGVGGENPPGVVLLDEPTRGMDRSAKTTLARRMVAWAEAGAAILTATHDLEFAALVSERSLLMARGRIVADGPTAEILSGGFYFATETARILGPGATAVLPEAGAEWLRTHLMPERTPGGPAN